MRSFVPAGKADEFADKNMQKASVQRHEILIARVGDKHYAANNRCAPCEEILQRVNSKARGLPATGTAPSLTLATVR